nr:unnamed protein product [Callosobruchus chinensis]
MLYEAQVRPGMEYCTNISKAPTTLSLLDAVQGRSVQLISVPVLMRHHQPLPHRRAVGDLSVFYRNVNGVCYFELYYVISPLTTPIRYTCGAAVPRVSRAWNGLPGDVFIVHATVGLFKLLITSPNVTFS